MTSDTALTLDAILKIVEVISILGGGGLVIFKMGKMTSRVETAMLSQATDISVLKDDVKVVGRLLTDVAVQKERLDGMDKRIDILDRRYDELRHGEGFVYPLIKGAHEKP